MYCFIEDFDGLWYKIPVSLRGEFCQWLEDIQEYRERLHENFDKYRCMHPCNYMFKSVKVLRETT